MQRWFYFLGGSVTVGLLTLLGLMFDVIQVGQNHFANEEGSHLNATLIFMQEEQLGLQKQIATDQSGSGIESLSLKSTLSAIETAKVALLSTATQEARINVISPSTPLRPHYAVFVGTGIFEAGTFSDGMAPLTEPMLREESHFNIQRIRPQEYPTGCDVSRYTTNQIWISGSAGMRFSVNGEVVGEYKIADDPHGYILEWPIELGDMLCVIDFKAIGYSMILGPDIYWHYDSYCYRGNC